MTAVRDLALARRSEPASHQRRRGSLGSALRWELRKLRAQLRTRAVLLGAVLGPIPVVVIIGGQSRPPKDTLFGRFATDNGFALALLVLGFASQWVLPLLTAVVAGDIFAGEDQQGTWKTVLTRSTSRGRIFWAKVLAATGFATLAVVLLATSTILSSLLVLGRDPLVGLSGRRSPPAPPCPSWSPAGPLSCRPSSASRPWPSCSRCGAATRRSASRLPSCSAW